ncbi:MAG: DUF2807 domain-containing protein [Muribaculaceae bacterium]|nr:DUF2807 domain-containing protein [Muribaculaceae bacterium]
MKKIAITIILSLLTCIGISAEGLMRYELDVKDFSELKVVEGINVIYKANADSAGHVVFIAEDKIASALTFNNSNDRLSIRLLGKDIAGIPVPTVTVYSKFLTKVENSGDSTVRVTGFAPCSEFKARLIGNGRLIVDNIDVTYIDGSIDTGNGQLILHGNVRTAKLSNTGKGTIQADNLTSSEVKCVMIGSGTIGCHAQKKLSVSGISSGKIYYKGKPAEIKNRAVGVSLTSLDNEN